MSQLVFDRVKTVDAMTPLYHDIKEIWYHMSVVEQMEFYNWLSNIGNELCRVWNSTKSDPNWARYHPLRYLTRNSE